MKKTIFTLALVGFCSTAFAAGSLFPPSSYGKWSNGEDGYTISKNGISTLNIKGCKPTYEVKKISGSELLTQIQENIEEAGDMEVLNSSYAVEMMKAANLIERNKQYTKIIGYHEKCAVDGAIGFIQLNNKVGLHILSAPEDVYSIIYKQ